MEIFEVPQMGRPLAILHGSDELPEPTSVE